MPFRVNPDNERVMKRTRNAMFGTLLLLSTIALAQVASAAVPASKWSATELADRTVERRAVEAVFWGMPAVNFPFAGGLRNAQHPDEKLAIISGRTYDHCCGLGARTRKLSEVP